MCFCFFIVSFTVQGSLLPTVLSLSDMGTSEWQHTPLLLVKRILTKQPGKSPHRPCANDKQAQGILRAVISRQPATERQNSGATRCDGYPITRHKNDPHPTTPTQRPHHNTGHRESCQSRGDSLREIHG